MDSDDKTNVTPQTSSQSSQNDSTEEVFENGLNYEDIIKKDVLELMGFTTLTQEKKDELHKKIEEAVRNRVAARVFDELSEEDRKQYEKLTDEEKFKEANDFLKSKSIDVDSWFVQEAIAMKLELYEDGKVVRKKVQEVIDQSPKKDE
jgi:hypothetical protein